MVICNCYFKDKSIEKKLTSIIFSRLNKVEYQDLKWMLISEKEDECDTNDIFNVKKLPISKWKNYVKENPSAIDVIVFKTTDPE